jgi:glycosyltransferase involved in cell wall biosynthesis
MRIAVFHNVTSGGAKSSVYDQVSLLSRKHMFDLFSLSIANQDFADIRPFVRNVVIEPFKNGRLFKSPLGRLNQGVRFVNLLRLRQAMKRLADYINHGDYDVALIHPCMFTFTPTILRYLKIPTLYYRHDPVRWVQDPLINRSYDRANRLRNTLDQIDPLRAAYYRLLIYEDTSSMHAATRIVTNSYFMRESLYRLFGVAPFVCYHAVDINLFRPLNLTRQQFVMSVGAIAPYKGYDFLIRSLACIPPTSRPLLILVGNVALPDEQQYLTELARQLDVELEFRHLISDEELVQLYNQAICTVYSPMMEPFGLVPLESMACGTPVVGIREGGVRETVVHNVTGLLADRDPEQFGQAILTLLQDRKQAEQLGKQARSYVEQQWQWDKAIAHLETHLQKTANSRHN